jgi:hypothetical protein
MLVALDQVQDPSSAAVAILYEILHNCHRGLDNAR